MSGLAIVFPGQGSQFVGMGSFCVSVYPPHESALPRPTPCWASR